MSQNLWNKSLLQTCKQTTGLQLAQEKQDLTQLNQDFGRLTQGEASAFFKAEDENALVRFIRFVNSHQLPITIRGNGLSQSGQSLAPEGAVGLDLSGINPNVYWQEGKLIAGCSASWKMIIEKSLESNQLPEVAPYNTDLTVGGVLSVGGLGASTFKKGIIGSHIESLKVLVPTGEQLFCHREKHQDLFQACLSGCGLFGIILEAEIKLRPCREKVAIYHFFYDDLTGWLQDQELLTPHVDYLEAYILDKNERTQQKQCLIQVACEFNQSPPNLQALALQFSHAEPVKLVPIREYCYRHDARLQDMRDSGLWDEYHPWYECYIDKLALEPKLSEIVSILDEAVGGIYHLFPVAMNSPRYFMFPSGEKPLTLNILSPGIKKQQLNKAIEGLQKVNDILVGMGGKRYISGWFHSDTDEDYWSKHYDHLYQERMKIKMRYDPNRILCSKLFDYA